MSGAFDPKPAVEWLRQRYPDDEVRRLAAVSVLSLLLELDVAVVPSPKTPPENLLVAAENRRQGHMLRLGLEILQACPHLERAPSPTDNPAAAAATARRALADLAGVPLLAARLVVEQIGDRHPDRLTDTDVEDLANRLAPMPAADVRRVLDALAANRGLVAQLLGENAAARATAEPPAIRERRHHASGSPLVSRASKQLGEIQAKLMTLSQVRSPTRWAANLPVVVGGDMPLDELITMPYCDVRTRRRLTAAHWHLNCVGLPSLADCSPVINDDLSFASHNSLGVAVWGKKPQRSQYGLMRRMLVDLLESDTSARVRTAREDGYSNPDRYDFDGCPIVAVHERVGRHPDGSPWWVPVQDIVSGVVDLKAIRAQSHHRLGSGATLLIQWNPRFLADRRDGGGKVTLLDRASSLRLPVQTAFVYGRMQAMVASTPGRKSLLLAKPALRNLGRFGGDVRRQERGLLRHVRAVCVLDRGWEDGALFDAGTGYSHLEVVRSVQRHRGPRDGLGLAGPRLERGMKLDDAIRAHWPDRGPDARRTLAVPGSKRARTTLAKRRKHAPVTAATRPNRRDQALHRHLEAAGYRSSRRGTDRGGDGDPAS